MPDAKATFRLEGEDATAAAFRSALGNVQEFSEKASAMLKTAFGFEAVNIFAEQIKGVAELGDGLVKGAERAGIAQQQFNQLAAAFGEADVSVQSLSRGLKNMEVAISKGANGDTTIASAFNEIGLSAQSLKQLAPDVELLAIAEALSKIEDPADRARIGTTLLGKSFLELEPVLAKGAAGLDEIVGAANGMDPETAAKLAKFNEQLNRLWQNVKLFAAGGAGYVASAFQDIHDTFSPDLARQIEVVNSQLQIAVGPGSSISPERIAAMKEQLAGLIALRDAAVAKPQSANVGAALDEQGKGVAEKIQNELTQAFAEALKAQEEVRKKNEETLDQWEQETRTAAEKVEAVYTKTEELFKAGRINRAEEFARDNQAGFTKGLAADSAQNQVAISQSIKQWDDTWHTAMDQQAEDARAAQQRMRAEFEKTGQYSVQTGHLIQETFATAFENIGQGGLRGLVADFTKAFAHIVAEAEAMDLAKAMHLDQIFGNNGGGSALGGIFSGLGGLFGAGGGSADSGFTPFTTGTAGLVTFLPGFATGGSFDVGGSGGTDSQLVAFRATPGEQVSVRTPGQQGAGGTINFAPVYNIGSGVSRSDVISACQATQKSAIAHMTKLIKGGAFA